MSAWPEQKSIVSTRAIGAFIGGPPAGSHRRGMAMVPSTSYLPQASTFPVGSRWMCSGTMAQSTGGSHLPVVASSGSGVIVMIFEILETDPAVKLSVCWPVPAMPRSVKAAVPLVRVVAVRAPWSVPVPLATCAVTATPESGTPPASLTSMMGWSVASQTSWSRAFVGGCLLMVMVAGVPIVASAGVPASGRVTLSPLHVAAPKARHIARTMRAARRIGDMEPWRRRRTSPCRIRATPGPEG